MEDALIQGASKNTDFLSILAARGVCHSWRSTCPRLVRSIVFDDSTILRVGSISNLDQANAACRSAGNALQRMILDSDQLDSLHLNITFDCIAGSVMDSLQQRPDLWPELRCVSLAMNPFVALDNWRKDWHKVIKGLGIDGLSRVCVRMGHLEGNLNGVCVRMGLLEGNIPHGLHTVFSYKLDLDSIVERPVGIFSGLRMLKLETVSGSFDAYKALPTMCRSLEHLYLKDMTMYDGVDEDYGNLYLPFSRLLTFHLEGDLDRVFAASITLDAPTLQQLYFMADLEDLKFTTQGTCLKEATCYEILSLDLGAAPALRKLSLVSKSGAYSLHCVEGYSKDEIVSLLTLAHQLEELEVGPYIIMKVTYHWNTSAIGCLPAINLLTIDVHPGLRNEDLCKDGLVRFALMFREVKQIKLTGGIQADLLQFQNGGGSHLVSKVELIPRT